MASTIKSGNNNNFNVFSTNSSVFDSSLNNNFKLNIKEKEDDVVYATVNDSSTENQSFQMQFDEYLSMLSGYGISDEDINRVKSGEVNLQDLLKEIDKDPERVKLIQQNSFLKQINQNTEEQYESYSDFVNAVKVEKNKLINLVSERNKINDSYRENDELMWLCNRLKQGEDLKSILESPACYKYKDEYGNVVYIYPDVNDGFLNYNSEIFDKKAEEVTFEEYFKNSELFDELKKTLSKEKRWTLLGKREFALYTGTKEQEAIFSKIEKLYIENYANRKQQLEEYEKNINVQKKSLDKLTGIKKYVDDQVEYYINNIHAYTSKDDFLAKSSFDKTRKKILEKSTYKISKNKSDVVDFYSCLINGEIVEKNGILTDKKNKYICDANQLSTLDNMLDNYLKWKPFISDIEKNIFNYILNTEGSDKAYKYLEDISDELDNRWLADRCKKDKEFAQEHEVLASVGSIFLTPVEGINAFAYSINSKVTGEEIRRSDVYSKGNIWRQSVSEEIHEYSSTWGFIYDTGMSMADSGLLIAASAATGGSANLLLSATIMGSRAYVSTLNDALDRGLSDNQAILLAASSAIVETAMENYSVGHLMNLEQKLGENTLKFTAKIGGKINNPKIARLVEKSFYILASSVSQGIAEGDEEFWTELLNYGIDIFISKDLSNYAQSMEKYISEGKSEDEALLLTMKDFKGQLEQAFLGGFASGVCFGAFGGANSTLKTSYGISQGMYSEFLGKNVSFSDALNFNRHQMENLQYASNEINNLNESFERNLTSKTIQQGQSQINVDLSTLTEEQINLLNNGTVEQQAGKAIASDIRMKFGKGESDNDNIVDNINTEQTLQTEKTKLFTIKDVAMILPDFSLNVLNLFGRKSMGSELTAHQNQDVLNKIKEDGIVHITSDESAGLILDSNYVKKTKAGIQSYGTAKSFFFAGTPTIEGVAFNFDKLNPVMTGVRIRPTDSQINDLRVRFSDGSIFNKGDFNFEAGQAEQVYYGLTFEDGNLVYKEITAEQAKNYQPDVTSEQLKVIQNKWALGLKTVLSGLKADRVKLLSDIQKYKDQHIYNEITKDLGKIEVNTKYLDDNVVIDGLSCHMIMPELLIESLNKKGLSNVFTKQNGIYVLNEVDANTKYKVLNTIANFVSNDVGQMVLDNETTLDAWSTGVGKDVTSRGNMAEFMFNQGKVEQANTMLINLINKVNDFRQGLVDNVNSEVIKSKNNIDDIRTKLKNADSNEIADFLANNEYNKVQKIVASMTDVEINEMVSKIPLKSYYDFYKIFGQSDIFTKLNSEDLNHVIFLLKLSPKTFRLMSMNENFIDAIAKSNSNIQKLIMTTDGIPELQTKIKEKIKIDDNLITDFDVEIPKLDKNSEKNSKQNTELNDFAIKLDDFGNFKLNSVDKISDIDFSSETELRESCDVSELFDDTKKIKKIKIGNYELQLTNPELIGVWLNKNLKYEALDSTGKVKDFGALMYYLKKYFEINYDISLKENFYDSSFEAINKEYVDLFETINKVLYKDASVTEDILDIVANRGNENGSINDKDFNFRFNVEQMNKIINIMKNLDDFNNSQFLSEMSYKDKILLSKFMRSGVINTYLNMSTGELKAVDLYQTGMYKEFNEYLDTHKEITGYDMKTVDEFLSMLMEKSLLKNSIVLQRATTVKEFGGIPITEIEGKILTQNRYKSSCIDSYDTIGTERGGTNVCSDTDAVPVRIDYVCPEGTKCVNLGMIQALSIVGDDVEHEALIGKNQKIRYDKVKKVVDSDGKVTYAVLATIIPDGVDENISIKDIVDSDTYDIIRKQYGIDDDLKIKKNNNLENIEVLEISGDIETKIKQENNPISNNKLYDNEKVETPKFDKNSNLLTANSEQQFNKILDDINQKDGISFLENLDVDDFQKVIRRVSDDKYLLFSSILSEKIILNTVDKVDQVTFNKMLDIIFSNSYYLLVLSQNDTFLNIFAERATDDCLKKGLSFGNKFSFELFDRIDKNKLNNLLDSLDDKTCFDDICKHYYKNEILLGEVDAINIYNVLKDHEFNTESVNQYFSWLANEYSYNIDVIYNTNIEINNDVYTITRKDGSRFDLKYLNTKKLSNGNEIYTYEYSYDNFGKKQSVIIYIDFDLNYMLSEGLNIENLINDFLSKNRIQQSINNYGYLGTYKLISNKFEQVINTNNINLIINETANQYYNFLNNFHDLNAGNTYGVDQHATANLKKTSPKNFKKLCKKLVSNGSSYKDAVKIMKNLDNTGACSYASICNTIFAFYRDNPVKFKNDFGFDMFVYNNDYNYYSLNTSELLVDLYLYANNKSLISDAKLFEGTNKIKIIEKTWLGDLKTKQQMYLSHSYGVNVNLINNYLKSKNSNLSFDCESIVFGQSLNNLSTDKINEVRKLIGDSLLSGKTVGLGIYTQAYDMQGTPIKKGNVNFRNSDGSVFVDTNSWSEGSGHAIFVTSVVENGVWVSSWGKKLFISFNDLQSARFTINLNSIYRVGE